MFHFLLSSYTHNERLFLVLMFLSHREEIKDRSSHAVKDIFSHLLDNRVLFEHDDFPTE